MEVLCAALTEILELTMDALRRSDWEVANSVEPLEQVIDHMKTILRNRHISRQKRGECSVEAGFIWSDLLTNLERVSDHCSNIAVSIMDAHEGYLQILLKSLERTIYFSGGRCYNRRNRTSCVRKRGFCEYW